MFRGLWKLTWLEIKIFLREPMGAFGSIVLPVLVFVVVGRFMGGRLQVTPSPCRGVLTRRTARLCVRADCAQRRIIAGHDHFDIPGGRNSEAAARHTASPADHSHCPRSGQAGADAGHHGPDGAGGQAILSD